MSSWRIWTKHVEVGVRETCGMLDPVRFLTKRGLIEPLHRAPWLGQPASDVPVLQNLRGDFFCAPFSTSDVLDDESRPHGSTANDRWILLEQTDSELRLELARTVSGARVIKTVSLKANHPIVYQRHELLNGTGRLPLGHHAMLYASEPLRLSFSPTRWGGTPPKPVETPESGGRSLLAYPQTFGSLQEVRRADGSTVDLSVYPQLEGSEEIAMLAADPSLPFAWSAAVAPEAGWVWFSLKNPRLLHSTLLWLSNGGRDYAPWLGRHRRVIGIEEVTSYFHLGHLASIGDNPVSAGGVPTALELYPDRSLVIPYAFGLVMAPQGFTRVETLEAHDQGLRISDGHQDILVPCDLAFITAEVPT